MITSPFTIAKESAVSATSGAATATATAQLRCRYLCRCCHTLHHHWCLHHCRAGPATVLTCMLSATLMRSYHSEGRTVTWELGYALSSQINPWRWVLSWALSYALSSPMAHIEDEVEEASTCQSMWEWEHYWTRTNVVICMGMARQGIHVP